MREEDRPQPVTLHTELCGVEAVPGPRYQPAQLGLQSQPGEELTGQPGGPAAEQAGQLHIERVVRVVVCEVRAAG